MSFSLIFHSHVHEKHWPCTHGWSASSSLSSPFPLSSVLYFAVILNEIQFPGSLCFHICNWRLSTSKRRSNNGCCRAFRHLQWVVYWKYSLSSGNCHLWVKCGSGEWQFFIRNIAHGIRDIIEWKSELWYFVFVLAVYDRNMRNFVALIGDNTSNNFALSRLFGLTFVGCHSHSFN